MNQLNPRTGANSGKRCGTGMIGAVRRRGVGFSRIDGGIGGGVDDQPRFGARQAGFDGLGKVKIEFWPAHHQMVQPALRRRIGQRMAKLAGAAGDEDRPFQ